MSDHIVWIVLFPLFGAVACALSGALSKKLCYPISVISMIASVWASVHTLMQAIESPVHEIYTFLVAGYWIPRGVRIEFRAGYWEL